MSEVIVAAAITGVAGAAVTVIAQNLINKHFEGLSKDAKKNAEKNAEQFLLRLVEAVETLKIQNQDSQKLIETALAQPDFSILFKKALIASTQTSNEEKHALLAMIVAERLARKPESVLALTSKLACDAIDSLTPTQLKILALHLNLTTVKPTKIPDDIKSQEQANDFVETWLIKRVGKLKDLNYSIFDLSHLESLSCIRISAFSQEIKSIMRQKFLDCPFPIDFKKLVKTDIWKSIWPVWDKGLKQTELTTVGQLVGLYTSAVINKTRTSLHEEWDSV